nr:hypothetical protein [Tanacetum cinerariifolium]
MDITIDQQVALDEALVPHASRLRIRKSYFRLRSEIKSKESTLQVVYDATATVHHHSIRFKMNNKKRIVNLEYFREMRQICPRIPNQQFDELPLEDELGHSGEIKMITGKNMDFAYLLWEDFVYKVEHKDAKKSNEMYYPRFTKVIISFFMTKDQSIPRRNKNLTRSTLSLLQTKASVGKKQSSSDTTMPPPTTTGKRLKTLAKVGQPAKSSTAKDDDDDRDNQDDDDDDDQDDDNDEQTDSDNDDDDFVHPKFSTHDEEDKDEESFDHIVQTPSQVENTDNEDNDEDIHDVQTTQVIKDTHVTLTLVNPEDVLVMTTAELPLLYATTLPPPSIPTISHVQQTPAPSPTNVPSSSLQDLPNFGSLFGFDHRLKTLETNFSKFMQTNQFAEAVSLIPDIVDKYIDHRMNEAVKVAVRLQSDRLQDEAQAQNEDFLNKLDENIQKIIKEQVKEQVKTSYAVATDLSELELKKILIKKMESNKSIHRSDEQKDLYKALVDAYECDKLILDTYGDMVTLKRRRDDEDKDEEPHGWIKPEVQEKTRRKRIRVNQIITITELQIVEWHNYKHLDLITVRRDDDKLYKFKEDNFKRLRIQDIEDMLLLLTIWRRSDKDRAEAMIQAIDKQLKTKRIIRSLEKFDCDGIPKRLTMYLNLWSYKAVRHRYSNPIIRLEPEGSTQGYPLVSVEVLRKIHTLAGNTIKELLLKLNLPDHMSILKDSQVTPTKHGRMTKPYSSPRFIANCFNVGYLKMEVKVPVSSCLKDS